MIALLAIFIAQIGMPFSMVESVGAAPTATPTPTAGTPTPTPGTVVAAPIINPSDHDSPTVVSITCATAGATIFYTLSTGGTNPTHSGSTPQGSTLVYSGSFNTGSGTKQVRALGYKSGLTDSAISIGIYSQAGGQ